MKLLAVFDEDLASKNIARSLLNKVEWVTTERGLEFNDYILKHYPGEHLYTENIGCDEPWMKDSIEGVIVLSRHRSKSGDPTLTIHPTGNYGDADFGGVPNSISMSYPKMMGALLRSLKSSAKETGFKVSLEVTHHGPISDLPMLFIEIG